MARVIYFNMGTLKNSRLHRSDGLAQTKNREQTVKSPVILTKIKTGSHLAQV